MMQWEVQQAVYNRLLDNNAVNESVDGRVFDEVPQGTEYPYINIGEDTAIAWDTDDSTGSESTLTLHVWSRKSGRREVKEIMRLIYASLHRAELVVAGAYVVLCDWEFSESFMDADGVTRHGVTRYRVILEENNNE